MRVGLFLFGLSLVVACEGSDSSGGGGATGGTGGTADGAAGSGGSAGSTNDAGSDADGAGAVGSGGTAGSGGVCNGSDFESCLLPVQDFEGACWEGSGFADPIQKSVFEQGCADAGGTLGTEPCSHAYPNVGGCTQPSTFCWVVWGLFEDDPSTPDDEHELAKAEYPDGCALGGGTYYPP